MARIYFLDRAYGNLSRPFDADKLKFETVLYSNASMEHNDWGTSALYGAMAFIVFVLLTLMLVSDLVIRIQFANEGMPVEVTVTACKKYQQKSSSHPDITYVYSVEGVEYTASEILSTFRTCKDFPAGTLLDGEYISSHPQTSRVLGEATPWLSLVFQVVMMGLIMMIFFAGFLGFVLFIVVYIRARLAYPRLKQSGQLLDGTVIESTGKQHGGRDRYYSVAVKYAVVTPDGRTLNRQQSKNHKNAHDLAWKILPDGARVKVLYADDDACVML